MNTEKTNTQKTKTSKGEAFKLMSLVLDYRKRKINDFSRVFKNWIYESHHKTTIQFKFIEEYIDSELSLFKKDKEAFEKQKNYNSGFVYGYYDVCDNVDLPLKSTESEYFAFLNFLKVKYQDTIDLLKSYLEEKMEIKEMSPLKLNDLPDSYDMEFRDIIEKCGVLSE